MGAENPFFGKNRSGVLNRFIRVSEFITVEKSGFVANILDAYGQFIDYSDENPKPLQEAKLLGAIGQAAMPTQCIEAQNKLWKS
jgi:hypothetical protein